MNTRLLMRVTAAVLAALGACATFLPQEVLAHFAIAPSAVAVVLIQIGGALYLGFAFLDWMAQGNLIGGVYSRPVAIGNFTHFLVGGLALVKVFIAGMRGADVIAAVVVYAVFAALFAFVLFTHPASAASAGDHGKGK